MGLVQREIEPYTVVLFARLVSFPHLWGYRVTIFSCSHLCQETKQWTSAFLSDHLDPCPPCKILFISSTFIK